MVKAVVESGAGAAAIPELMVKKELQLATMRSLQIVDFRENYQRNMAIVQPVVKLKHRQRF